MPLDLIANEVVAYRFRADWHSINVVVVKLRGASSKNAGQEYEETLAYCRDVRSAASWLFHHLIRAEGETAQAAKEVETKALADMDALKAVVGPAERHVLAAVEELEKTLNALGMTQKQLVKALAGTAAGAPPAEGEAERA